MRPTRIRISSSTCSGVSPTAEEMARACSRVSSGRSAGSLAARDWKKAGCIIGGRQLVQPTGARIGLAYNVYIERSTVGFGLTLIGAS